MDIVLRIILITSVLMSLSSCHVMEIILEDESPAAAATAPLQSMLPQIQLPPPVSFPFQFTRQPEQLEENVIGKCNVEFQVPKIYPGRCMKLGKNGAYGCVAGNHIVPFHQDCM